MLYWNSKYRTAKVEFKTLIFQKNSKFLVHHDRSWVTNTSLTFSRLRLKTNGIKVYFWKTKKNPASSKSLSTIVGMNSAKTRTLLLAPTRAVVRLNTNTELPRWANLRRIKEEICLDISAVCRNWSKNCNSNEHCSPDFDDIGVRRSAILVRFDSYDNLLHYLL